MAFMNVTDMEIQHSCCSRSSGMKGGKEGKNMTEQLDKTITAISQWIQEQFEQGYVSGDINLPEMTKALAELVSARAAINE